MHEPLTSTELELLEAYVAGVADDVQCDAARALLARRPELAPSMAQLQRRLIDSTPAPVPVDQSWSQFRARVGMDAPQGTVLQIPAERHTVRAASHAATSHRGVASSRGAWSRTPRAWFAGSAAILTAAIVAIVIAIVIARHDHQDAVVPMRQYATTVGQRATITLSDGARVTLAPGTSLRVPVDFGRATRTVWLDGEAYFDVPHTAGTPFVVRTGSIRTHVLGTAFDVRRYAGDRAVQVAVVTGKVAVTASTSEHASVTLSAGRVGLVTDSTATAAAASDMAPYTGWLDGRLVFERTPVRDVLAAVGRWYGYEFRLSDSVLATRYLSASFDHQSTADMLSALKTVLQVTMTFDGHVVTLHPKSHSATPSDTRRQSKDLFHVREVGR